MVRESAIMVAVSPEGVIGVGGKIPWRYRGDLRRLKRLTVGTTVIMGRATWESIGSKPLPDRRNVVITARTLPEVQTYQDIPSALAAAEGFVWFLGGARIYADAMTYCDFLDVTYVPDSIAVEGAIRFPDIDPRIWDPGPLVPHEDEPTLVRRVYTRRSVAT